MCKSRRVGLIAAIGIFAVIAAGAVYLHQRYVLPVLMYHSVLETVAPGNRLAVSARTFDRQMGFLRRFGYRVLPLEQAVEVFKDGKRPARTVVITFDDGFADNFTYAFPVLQKYRIPATVFLIYSSVGTPGYLDWDQIRQMRDSGLVTFGSHSVSHPSLPKLAPDALAREVEGSKELLEERLGRPVALFAYPMGQYDCAVQQAAVKAGYAAAVATNPGKKAGDRDVFAIKRLRISENAGNLAVFFAETSGYYNFVRENRHK